MAVGCVPADEGSGSATEENTDQVIPERPTPAPPEGADSLAELPGRLAIVNGPTLVVVDPDGANRQTFDEADHVGQPTWSPTGQALAWTRAVGPEASLTVRAVATDGPAPNPGPGSGGGAGGGGSGGPDDEADGGATDEPARLEAGLGQRPAIYLSWSDGGDRIGVLRNAESLPPDLEFSIVDVSVDESTIGPLDSIAVGQPLYTAWHPGEPRLATHVGPRVDVWPGLFPDADPPPLFSSRGAFAAPAWLDPETLVVADGATLGRLEPESGDYEPLVPLEGATRFVVSSDGTRIAYLARADSDVFTVSSPAGAARPQTESPTTSLHVLDVESGLVSVVGAAEMRRIEPISWEWSPDGQFLAFLADSELEPSRARWYFWHGGAVVAATSIFVPSSLMARSYLPFFDQYAQSITGWSPDSQAFAFAGSVDGVPGVYVHVLGTTPRSIRVTDGEMVTWSPENVAPGTGESLL